MTDPKPFVSNIELMLQAVLKENATYDLSALDLVTSRTALRKLFRLLSTPNPEDLKFYVELIKPSQSELSRCVADVAGTCIIYQGDLQDDDDIEDTGDDSRDDHGAELLEYAGTLNLTSSHNTNNKADPKWDDTKVLVYDFAGMKCMVKYPPLLSGPGEGIEKEFPANGTEDTRCWRVKKKKTVRSTSHVDEWMMKMQNKNTGAPQSETHHNYMASDCVNGKGETKMPGDNAGSEANEMERRDKLVELNHAMERVGLHRHPIQVVPVGHHDSNSSDKQNTRPRADSSSSTSSAYSQGSISTRSTLSSTPTETHQFYHYKKPRHIPCITAGFSPPEEEPFKLFLGFDTPVLRIWYNGNLSSSFFNVEAVYPNPEEPHCDSSSEVAGTYRSVTKYTCVLRQWEKDHIEALCRLVLVLRKIRKAAGKSGRCKVVVDKTGRVMACRVKRTQQEEEGGRASILPAELVGKWF